MNKPGNQRMEKSRFDQSERKRVWIAGVIVLLVLLLFSVCFITKTVTAQRYTERTKQVVSIEIMKGDTLWSIASAYITEEYDDINEYIEEIKSSNGLISDDINAGNYIIVPYYTDSYQNSNERQISLTQ